MSIITVVLNGKSTVIDCIQSVYSQNYPHIEHIIIDGGSNDGTLELIQKYRSPITHLVSEPDRGIYDAMNKGIKLATGEVIGILNCDDIYIDKSVITDVVAVMLPKGIATCYGDLQYVKKEDLSTVVRSWRAGVFSKNKFKYGWMPPHPAFFVKKIVYEKYGGFNLDLPIAADYELMLRFLYKNDVATVYLPKVLVKMRTQGKSSPGICNTLNMMREECRAWQLNDLDLNLATPILKRLIKIKQFFSKG